MVFRRSEIVLRKPSLGNAFLIISEPIFDFWLQKSQYSTGFIRVSATRFCIWENSKFDRFYKVFRRFGIVLRKPSLGNAFSIISEPIFDFGLQKSQFSTGFIRVSATRFCIVGISKIDRFYKVCRRFGIVLRKPSLGNAFLIISEPIFDFWLRKSQSSTGFIRFFATRFCVLKICEFQWRY